MKNDAKSQWSDAELIHDDLNNDDGKAFEVLCNRYRVRVLGYVTLHVKNRSDAEEIVQDAFLEASKQLKKLRDAEKFLNWMFSIAEQRVAAWYRKNQTRIEFEPISDVSEQTLYDIAVTADQLDEERTIDDALLEYILGLVDALQEPERRMFLLQLDGFSYEEISDELSISVDAVKHKLYRARKKLREQSSQDS